MVQRTTLVKLGEDQCTLLQVNYGPYLLEELDGEQERNFFFDHCDLDHTVHTTDADWDLDHTADTSVPSDALGLGFLPRPNNLQSMPLQRLLQPTKCWKTNQPTLRCGIDDAHRPTSGDASKGSRRSWSSSPCLG